MIGLVKWIIGASEEQKAYQDTKNTMHVKKMLYFLTRCSHGERAEV